MEEKPRVVEGGGNATQGAQKKTTLATAVLSEAKVRAMEHVEVGSETEGWRCHRYRRAVRHHRWVERGEGGERGEEYPF